LEDLHDDDIEVERNINGPYFIRAARSRRNISEWCSSDYSGHFGDRLMRSFKCGVRHYEGRFANCKRNRPFCDGQWNMDNPITNNEMAGFREGSALGCLEVICLRPGAMRQALFNRRCCALKPQGSNIVLGYNCCHEIYFPRTEPYTSPTFGQVEQNRIRPLESTVGLVCHIPLTPSPMEMVVDKAFSGDKDSEIVSGAVKRMLP